MSRLAETIASARGAVAIALLVAPVLAQAGPYGLGRPALPEEIAAWDIDIRPDGAGLPEGAGDVATGEGIWLDQCVMCHGDFGEAVGRWPQIAGGEGTLASDDPVKTPGSYWPYLSTIYDYVHRAMPFGNAQSLSPDEVYALTAYILYLNFQVEDDFTLSRANFLEVEMPNADGFFMDDRAETELPAFSAPVCMADCAETVEITARAAVIDVTPDEPEGGFDLEGGATGGEVTAQAAPAQVEQAQAEQAPSDAEAASDAAAEAPVETEAAGADPDLAAAGAGVFRKCQACHQVGEGARNRVGPHLNGVVDRAAASVDGFRYSPALAEAAAGGLVWDDAALAGFLKDPRGYLPGTKMSFAGLPDDGDIAAVIAYIKSEGG